MAIYIKGMEMPNSCMECPFYAGNGCSATHTLFDSMTNVGTRVCGCPLTEVSEPSADAEWIPCSERLPSEDGCYLVCMAWDYCVMEVLKWADGWNCYRGYDGKVERESEIDGVDIIAWMPLPKPYREENEE